MDLSIIIVSWKVKEKLRENLLALVASRGDFSWEIFVVDNNSGDGTVDMVKKEFPDVKLIANNDNLGFAAANNQAIKQASGDFILLLNPDMRVNNETLEASWRWAQAHPTAVVTGIKLTDLKGQVIPQVRLFPKFFNQLMIVLKVPHFLPSVLNKYLCAGFDYQQASRVDSVRGAYFLINKKAWHRLSGQPLPLLDERYFIWFEEVDFCRQVYQAGGEVWYTPVASCLDYVGQSFNQVGTGTKQRYFEESMLKYFAKWESRSATAGLRLAWPLGRLLAKIFS
jgi:GT2 family glycosyltransferase